MAAAEASSRVPTGSAPTARAGARSRLKALAGLTGVQLFWLLSSLVTAPLVAQALGPDGRGLLATVAVPLSVAVYVLDLGLAAYAVNRVAQGASAQVVFGSLALPLLAVAGVVAVLSPQIAAGLSNGREPVEEFLTIGLALMPISLLIRLGMSIALGSSQWRVLAAARLMTPLVVFLGVISLSAVGKLTVGTAAAVTIASGLAPLVALIPIARHILPPHIDQRVVRTGLGFGARVWMGQTATMANQRLDQLLMIPLVPPRELGLYAVAVTIASISTVLASQITTVIVPRIAGGESDLVPQAIRCVLLTVLATGAVIALATHFLLVPLFGTGFAEARPLVYVLLVAWLSQAGLSALGEALPALGRPGAPSVGEFVSLAITVPGLLLVLPSLGARGAALVSLAAYTTTFAVVLGITTRTQRHRAIEYVVPRRADLAMLVAHAASVLRLARRLRTDG